MSPVRTVHVPWFGSQQGPSQRDEPQPDCAIEQTELSRQGLRGRRGNKRGDVGGEQTRSILKVKLPKLNKKATKEDRTHRRLMSETAASKTETTESRKGAATDCDAVGGDVFSFPQRPTGKAINEKKKAKLAVIRTICKVLEENQLIRQRLAALSHAN